MNNKHLAIESFISFCDDMMIAEEGLFSKKKYKSKIKDIINSISVKKKFSFRTSVDKDTVAKFITALESNFEKIAYSKIIHVTGDYNYFTQKFAVLTNGTICLFNVIYDETQIKMELLSGSLYNEIVPSEYNFDATFVMNLYSEILPILANGFSVKRNKITINSYDTKLDSIYSKIQDDNYDFSLEKNGYKIIISTK